MALYEVHQTCFVAANNVPLILRARRTRMVSRQRFRVLGFSAADPPDKVEGVARHAHRPPAVNRGGAKNFFAAIRSQNDDLKNKLRRYGTAGILSYGIFNTVYYLGTFLFFWFFVDPSPGGLGYVVAAQRFMKLLAMVWAGSQVTKLLRATAALALAPLVDKGLSWFTTRFHFESREKAFGAIVAGCFALALLVFVVITSLWA